MGGSLRQPVSSLTYDHGRYGRILAATGEQSEQSEKEERAVNHVVFRSTYDRPSVQRIYEVHCSWNVIFIPFTTSAALLSSALRMFQVLHSSAGAGKTHALVKHYLGHCLSTGDHAAYRQVLALTFTNKAAGELKERVLLYLDDLAKARVDEARIADLMEHLSTIAKVDQAAIATRAAACLKHMLHHWGDVAIGTIDSFTRRVVQPFARDLQPLAHAAREGARLVVHPVLGDLDTAEPVDRVRAGELDELPNVHVVICNEDVCHVQFDPSQMNVRSA